MPTISVIMPNYNHGRYVAEALGAVLEQSFQPLEIIVVDDASRDDSVAVIEGIARRNPLVRLLRNRRNRGVMATVNRGLKRATGDYVYLPAADDRTLPGAFERIMDLAGRHPEAGMVFGKVVKVTDGGQVLATFEVTGWQQSCFADPGRFLHEYLEAEPPTHSLCGATFYRRDALVEVGGYRSDLGHWCDTFAARAVGLKYGACYVPEPIMHWRYAPGSLAHATPVRKALDVVRRAARLMRSPAFRDRFPAEYVDAWEADYRESILRSRQLLLPERRQALEREAEAWHRRQTGRLRHLDVLLNRWLWVLPAGGLERAAGPVLDRFGARRVEDRLRRETTLLRRARDPNLRGAGLGKTICELLPAPARKVRRVDPALMEPQGKFLFLLPLDRVGVFAPSDEESVSGLVLLEDGRPLPWPHAYHADVAEQGGGRYSHWGSKIYFSSSDGSDPRHNGRTYALYVPHTLFSWYRARKIARHQRRGA